MDEKNIKNVEDLGPEGLAAFILDLAHRMSVHETLWFREVEHQLGQEKAMEAMEYAWSRTRINGAKRLGQTLGFETEENGLPNPLVKMPREDQMALLDAVAKNWLAQDGFWFQAVEFTRGMNDAKRCNDSTWGRFSPFEARSIKEFLGMDEYPGLKGLETALNFRMYGRLNEQRCRWETDGSLIFEMNRCRVQTARIRKGLDDYPCKTAGLVEYTAFAEAIDSRIQTRCLGCPPDNHPAEWFCAWQFSIPEEA